jgi:hypothetical protein
MSRVVYEQAKAAPDQERLRAEHKLRLVTDAEEGLGVDAVPNGVYGFTYSPAFVNSPLYATRRFRCYETHRRLDGSVYLMGFVSAEDAAKLANQTAPVEICLQPEPEEGAKHFVELPHTRILHHRLMAVRTEHGVTMKVGPA